MSRVKKLLYSLTAGLSAALIALYIAGGQPGEYKVSLATTLPPEKILPYLTEPDLIKKWMPVIQPGAAEVNANPRSRSAQLRVIEKV